MAVNRRLAREHYKLLRNKPFFDQIVDYLSGKLHGGSPVVAMAFTGNKAVNKCRAIAGATNPEDADPRSVRGKLGRVTTKGVFENLVHVSGNTKESARELKLWFKKHELLD